jgi:hypothetical protein
MSSLEVTVDLVTAVICPVAPDDWARCVSAVVNLQVAAEVACSTKRFGAVGPITLVTTRRLELGDVHDAESV